MAQQSARARERTESGMDPRRGRTQGPRSALVLLGTLLLSAACQATEPARGRPPNSEAGVPEASATDAAPSREGQPQTGDGAAGPAIKPTVERDAANDEESGADGAGTEARWLMYGYDLANSQHNPHETKLGIDNVAMLREQWRIRMPAGATSTPVVADGMVYFGAWDGNAYAADAATGELRWQRKVTPLLVRSTPMVGAERVYFAAGPNVIALDRNDGHVLFEATLATHPETLLDSSPKLVEDMILIGLASVENTFDKPDYNTFGAVIALDSETGEELWRVATTGVDAGRCAGGAGASVWSSVAVDPELGLAFIGVGQNHEHPVSACSDALLAIHYRRTHAGERIAWVQQYTAGDVYAATVNGLAVLGPDADIGAAPNLFEANGRAVVGAGDKAGSYRVFDRSTGEPVWRANLDVGLNTQTGGVMTTAAVHDGLVFVTSNHVDQATAAVILDPTSAISNYATLYALDAASGRPQWQVKVPSTVSGSFALANGVLYQPSGGKRLYARDMNTGVELLALEVEDAIGAGPSVVNGRLYVSVGYGIGKTSASPAPGGYVLSFGLEPGPPRVWDAKVEVPTTLSIEQCTENLSMTEEWPKEGGPDEACTRCLCSCNSTAAGSCTSCWQQASCAVSLCSLATPEELRTCVGTLCTTKLVPSYTFEQTLAAAPCMFQCASVCGF